jgi:4-amino-4-deoxy-L-arabinose transferase-like glycosyltransferase
MPEVGSSSARSTARLSDFNLVLILAVLAGAIRLYLVFTSYCISADGIAYIAMAREFHAGRWNSALSWVFSPLYPWLISIAYYVVQNWEIAGELWSAALGSAGVVLLFYLMRAVYGRRDIAAGAAAITAIHPMLAGFSASVRTEAGYIALVTAATLLLVRGAEHRRLRSVAAAAVVCGFAYLYRTEGVGIPVLFSAFLIGGSFAWRRWSTGWAIRAAAALVTIFLLIAAPYLLWMRSYTGHWTVGRELGVVTMEATGSTMGRLEQWREMGYRRSTSWLTPLRMNPALYLRKVARDFFGSCYAFVQALGPLLCVGLVIGLFTGGGAIVKRWPEALLAALVLMYFAGFVLTDTGPRLMLHVVPFTFGWVAAGLIETAGWLDAAISRSPVSRFASGFNIVAATVAIALLPRTLFPLGYDQRGMRYAGHEIARRAGGGPVTIAGNDARTAFYANAGFIALPARPQSGEALCGWLAAHPCAGYLMIDGRAERRWGGSWREKPCLVPIKRYPRVGDTYYDLFAVRGAEPASLNRALP